MRRFVLLVLAAIALAALPSFWPGYGQTLLTVIFYWVALAGAWNLMSGYTGYIDFGSAAYTGLGAYLAALLALKLNWPLGLACPAAGLGSLLTAVALGWPTLRLKGAYFAIATFALAETLKQLCEELGDVTGGGIGLTLPARFSDQAYYFIYLGLAAAVTGLALWLEMSKHGLGLKAIREDEPAAAQVGVDTLSLKLRTYAGSAFFIGLLGALEGSRLGYFKPGDVFDLHITIKMVTMSLLGGLGTPLGPALGAAFLQVLEDLLGARFLNYYLVLVGVAIVAVVLFRPRGALGGLRLGRRP